eukprot:1833846-Lingulodinium_polyedra.AAC.1
MIPAISDNGLAQTGPNDPTPVGHTTPDQRIRTENNQTIGLDRMRTRPTQQGPINFTPDQTRPDPTRPDQAQRVAL